MPKCEKEKKKEEKAKNLIITKEIFMQKQNLLPHNLINHI